MFLSLSYQVRRAARLVLLAGLALSPAVFAAPKANAQAAAMQATDAHSRILLVLPFDNRSNQPNLEWIREAAPELLTSRLLSAGFAPLSRADRRYALDHLGFPQNFHPSRATSLKLAQTMDADSVIVGSFTTSGSTITAEAQIVDVPHLRMSQPVTAQGEMRSLIAVFDELAWELTRQLDPVFPVDEETFVAAGANLKLEAFEQYIRGISEADHTERLNHLQAAVKLSPDFADAWMALGREDFSNQDYEHAAEAFAKVTGTGADSSSDAQEASFYRGLSLLYTGNYPGAETAFASVARSLPLAAVLNNQAVAVSRQGHDGSALFRQAVTADPEAPDYHFNLAVSLKRHGDANGAAEELGQYLKLRPTDTEALDLGAAWKQPRAESGTAASEPLERIARNFDAVAFRQAAIMLDQMESARLAALPPRQHAEALVAHGREYLSHGLVLEASRNANAALRIDPGNVAASALLREIAARQSQK